MKKVILLLTSCIIAAGTFAQTERFDIATFVPPPGWQRTETNGSVAFIDSKTENGLTSFCQIVLYPSSSVKTTADKNFKAAWQNLVAIPIKSKAKPVTQTERTPDGWTVVTGHANVAFQGLKYKSIVANITGFGKTMSVQVNTAGGDYGSTLEKFFNDLNLDNKAAPATATQTNTGNTMSGPVRSNDYEFIAPEGWQTQKNADHILVQSPQSGCAIRILEPQPATGDLEQLANAVFDMMYTGWQYQKAGEQQYTLSKGYLPKGLEFFLKEATMSRSADGRYDLEDGAAMVVKAGSQVVIISVRHTGLLAHTDCIRKYNTWRRFFNSFTVKNASIPKRNENPGDQLVGSWSMLESGATGEYVFAANGNYALIGAIGSTYTSRDFNYEYLHIKTYSFQGDGSYSISGDQLVLKKGQSAPRQVRVRFEKVKRGHTAWKDRLFMLTKDQMGDYEVAWDRQR
jgi:hypothetical protein